MYRQSGFTLVELAIAILVMSLLIGGLALPLAAQRDRARVTDAERLVTAVDQALLGYAIANGHFPCPATPASNGLSAVQAGGCVRQHGFVPASTLGISGARNADNLLVDSWANPLRYSVSASDFDGNGNWDFTHPGEMRNVGMASLTPDLVICNTAAGSSVTACANAAATLSDQAVTTVLSMGKDWSQFAATDQVENVGSTVSGGPSSTTYRIASDRVFVSRRPSLQTGQEFDDVISWTSPMLVYKSLLESGQLP